MRYSILLSNTRVSFKISYPRNAMLNMNWNVKRQLGKSVGKSLLRYAATRQSKCHARNESIKNNACFMTTINNAIMTEIQFKVFLSNFISFKCFLHIKLILSKFLIYFQSLKSIDKFIQGTLQTYTKDDVEDVRCADDGYPTDDQLVMPSAARSTNLPNRFARGISTNSKLSLYY